jgi:hypothetical protein
LRIIASIFGAEAVGLPRAEAHLERERDDRRGHVLVDGGLHRPAALARVGHVALDVRQSPGVLFEPAAMSSSSQLRTTEPFPHSSAMAARSSLKGEVLRISKPSAYACISPYSMPLWIIFT